MLSRDTVAKLGEGAACRFRVSSGLTVTLGGQSTILPNGTVSPDVIALAPNTISSATGNAALTPTEMYAFNVLPAPTLFPGNLAV